MRHLGKPRPAAHVRAKKNERGSALVLVVFALALLAGMGIALLVLSETEVKLSTADLRGKKAFYLAEAGLEHARMALFAANGNGSFDDDLYTASGGGGGNETIDFDADALVPTYDSYGRLTGFGAGLGDDTPIVPPRAFAEGVYMAYLHDDPIDPVATPPDDTNDRVMVTAIGGGPNRSFEIVQAVLEKDPILPGPPPSALTLLGPDPEFDPGSSPVSGYSGNDCGGAGVPGLYVPTVGVIGTDAEGDVESDMGNPYYESGGLPEEDTIADLTDITEPTVSTPIDPIWTDCPALKAMIEEIRGVADIVCTTPACVLPAPHRKRVVFADTDITIGPPGGAGLLVVTRTLTTTGNSDWQGVILVIGEGNYNRLGMGPSVTSGAVVVADIAGPDETYGTADDCTGGDGGFAEVDYSVSGGGISSVQFCLGDIVPANPTRLYSITQFLQR